MGAVDVKQAGERELVLEWDSSASNDMIADSTLALITGIDKSPASVKRKFSLFLVRRHPFLTSVSHGSNDAPALTLTLTPALTLTHSAAFSAAQHYTNTVFYSIVTTRHAVLLQAHHPQQGAHQAAQQNANRAEEEVQAGHAVLLAAAQKTDFRGPGQDDGARGYHLPVAAGQGARA